ncbi:MAG TPA: glycosyltransferase [Thermoflexales bacterium]|nr:glycosyltransferase [Thermoflexales bacterium]HQW33922.1 glycosyltransferase [Thermoflexales bacterium]HQZ21256.1 glycosyltransferase [Thermoflexales bacterium]HQZ98694.1 glycosyltransferase [Thermoflexales bacterium]
MITFIGDLQLDTGVGEAARGLLDAALSSGEPAHYLECALPHAHRRAALPAQFDGLLRGANGDINLLGLHLHQAHRLTARQLNALTGARYTIPYWVWEFEQLPARWAAEPLLADEIWTPSTFAARAMQAAGKPVYVIPHVVSPPGDGPLAPLPFSVEPNRFVFLHTFSASSLPARKNPLGVIHAFRAAIANLPPKDRPLLIIKAQHLDGFPAAQKQLRDETRHDAITLIDQNYTAAQMAALRARANCFISLHRAEGFGLGLAEAMAAGKPVIATKYCGPADYISEANGYPVPFTLREVTDDDTRGYPDFAALYRGQRWAEPDLSAAASAIRHACQNAPEARQRGAQAARDILAYCGREAVSQRISARLAAIRAGMEREPAAKRQHTHNARMAQLAVARQEQKLAAWQAIHRKADGAGKNKISRAWRGFRASRALNHAQAELNVAAADASYFLLQANINLAGSA